MPEDKRQKTTPTWWRAKDYRCWRVSSPRRHRRLHRSATLEAPVNEMPAHARKTWPLWLSLVRQSMLANEPSPKARKTSPKFDPAVMMPKNSAVRVG